MRTRENVPLIRQLRENAELARREEVQRALRLLEKGEAPASVLEQLSRALTNKLLHAPTVQVLAARDPQPKRDK
jgi:glutamyl-tRNA reductase